MAGAPLRGSSRTQAMAMGVRPWLAHPGAIRSGFMRPSTVGPKLELDQRAPLAQSVPPTVRVFLAEERLEREP